MFSVYNSTWLCFVHAPVRIIGSASKIQRNTGCLLNVCGWASWVSSYLYIVENVYKFSYVITLAFSVFCFRFRNAMLKSICEVLDLERSGVNSELVKRILNFLMHPKPSGKPLTKSKKSSSKGNKKERNSSGMARKAKRTKCPEILSDESSSDEEEKKNKEESSEDEDKESEEEVTRWRFFLISFHAES